jgi:NTE family protein
MAGLASGLRREGVNLAGADLIVGTSAGAIVGTMLATRQDLDAPGGPGRPAGQGGSAPRADPGRLAEVFAILGDARLEPADARRRVGRLALTAKTITEQAHIAMISALITAREWPDDAEGPQPLHLLHSTASRDPLQQPPCALVAQLNNPHSSR